MNIPSVVLLQRFVSIKTFDAKEHWFMDISNLVVSNLKTFALDSGCDLEPVSG